MKWLLSIFVALSVSGCFDPYAQYQQVYELARSRGLPIVIDRITVSSPNSVGGVDLYINATNVSGRTIKYLVYNARAYNAVGDPVVGEISRSSITKVRETGPIPPNGRSSPYGVWSNSWYNHSIRCARITRVEVIFMDGGRMAFSSEGQIKKLLRPDVSNFCG